MADAFIVAAVRTAGGRRGGRLKDWHPADLSGLVIDGLLDRVDLDPQAIEDVIWGCTGQVGEQSANIGRAAALSSRLGEQVPGTTIDRQCGSSQQTIHFAAQAVLSGTQQLVLAGGVESMSRIPIGLSALLGMEHGFGKPGGARMDARYAGQSNSQFASAEMMAEKYGIGKDDLDAFALGSHRAAAAAADRGAFADQIVPVPIGGDGAVEMHDRDEGIRADATIEQIAGLKPILENGLHTAATASQICDGAAALLLASESAVREHGLRPIARLHHLSVIGHDPVIMLEAPLPATDRALARSGLTIGDIGLAEVNEAFASVPLAWLRHTGFDPDKLNVNGGAIALGHPLGATGAKLMTTLVHALHERGARYGLQTVCEAGGMANVAIIERL